MQFALDCGLSERNSPTKQTQMLAPLIGSPDIRPVGSKQFALCEPERRPLRKDLASIYGLGMNVSSQLKKLIGNVILKKVLFLGLSVELVLAAHVSAQESAVQYIEYPQILGKVQPLHLSRGSEVGDV